MPAAPQAQIIHLAAQPAPPPPQQSLGPRQVQHKEAYIKYISNLRKQQHMQHSHQHHHHHNPHINSDWLNSIDIRASRVIKESRVMPPPAAWIENCETGDVLKHLVSLRCYMLNDAVNIQQRIDKTQVDEEESREATRDAEQESEANVLLEL